MKYLSNMIGFHIILKTNHSPDLTSFDEIPRPFHHDFSQTNTRARLALYQTFPCIISTKAIKMRIFAYDESDTEDERFSISLEQDAKSRKKFSTRFSYLNSAIINYIKISFFKAFSLFSRLSLSYFFCFFLVLHLVRDSITNSDGN